MSIFSTGKQFQLINDEGNLVADQESNFEKLKMDAVNKNYYT